MNNKATDTSISTIDIETMPDKSRIKDLPPAQAKYGNTKDPAKRAEMDVKAASEQVGKMALNPLFGQVASYAVVQNGVVVDSQVINSSADMTERVLLDRCLQWLRFGGAQSPRLCTWNGSAFDIPFLYKRALFLDLRASEAADPLVDPGKLTEGLPPLKYFTKRYETSTHIDLPLIWGGWAPQSNYTSLDSVAGALLGAKKIDFDVSLISELVETKAGRKQLLEYNEKDALLTDAICHAIEHVLF